MMHRLILSILLTLGMLGCEEVILHDLTEVVANQVKVKLSQGGINSNKKRQGALWEVSVASAEATKALALLEDSRVLKKNLAHNSEASKSLILSKEEREYFIERELSWGLEQTLEAMPAILEARVHLNLKNKSELDSFKKPTEQSASVLLICEPNCNVEVSRIQKLVSGASGMSAGVVQVIITQMKDLQIQGEQNQVIQTPKKSAIKIFSVTAFILKNQKLVVIFSSIILSTIVLTIVFKKNKNSLNEQTQKLSPLQEVV